jgi:hypothetical protein
MSLFEILREYQILLEKHRQDPDCEETWRMLLQARREMRLAHGLAQIRL